MITRRLFLARSASLLAAPAIIKASSLMPVKAWIEPKMWVTMPAASPSPSLYYLIEEVRRDMQRITGIFDLSEQRYRLSYDQT